MFRRRRFLAMPRDGFVFAPNAMGRFHGGPVPLRRGERVTIHPWEEGLLYHDGVLVERLGPGSRRIRGARHELATVDLRPLLETVPTQEVPTAEGVPVKVTAVARRRVVDAEVFVDGSQGPNEALYLAVQLAVREVVATTTVDELLTSRAELPGRLLAALRGVEELGLAVDALELKDVVLPGDLKRANAQVLIARAEGQAALERARGETAALRSLANAARLTAEHPMLFQLRLLQQLAATSGHTVVIGGEPAVAPVTARPVPPDAT